MSRSAPRSHELCECFLARPHLWNIWLRWSQGKGGARARFGALKSGCPRLWPPRRRMWAVGTSTRICPPPQTDALLTGLQRLLDLKASSQSRQCFPLSIALKPPASLQRGRIRQTLGWNRLCYLSADSAFIQRIPELRLWRESLAANCSQSAFKHQTWRRFKDLRELADGRRKRLLLRLFWTSLEYSRSHFLILTAGERVNISWSNRDDWKAVARIPPEWTLALFLVKQEPEDTSTAALLNLEHTENILEVKKTRVPAERGRDCRLGREPVK